ncbi:hypothetical protein VNO77_25177 [Canavalia gladiata]|uniref:Uncharacterized protein n=1 Tax=Canavalia gladiata TaxID=3824 RepID=A0AAN9L7N1_CANGL
MRGNTEPLTPKTLESHPYTNSLAPPLAFSHPFSLSLSLSLILATLEAIFPLFLVDKDRNPPRFLPSASFTNCLCSCEADLATLC